ncbi:TPA: hypothetical protein NEO27_004649 [Pseudomonas aeruginosa]|uniref:hypothetical protein n=1 Tax=Pseudomonas TaxID=286 RepID=UPI00053E634D|nr:MULTISPECIES: hypothetical protein [Pseudomonas]ELD6250235.1 hypothetical protein [Pseudomonas aeruginosa]ELP1405042.1 hypothetical protein [Pseudomonas aeruginosa]MBG5377073.1 hypothetical protein [Pseudomonas aeruginosa]MDF2240328.1 hypothetical protein [Pseudomonas aeruginosa]MDI3182471.1 hypothetical protein [Pseudomonas paracarnis]
MPKLIPAWLWPRLTPSSPEDESRQQKWLRSEQEKVDQGSWADKSDVALEEARRLFDAEHERRRGADSKAGLYLAAITALIPILATILPGLWNDQISRTLRGTLLGIFICALLYLMRAGLWALQTIKTTPAAQLGAGDIAESFSSDKPEEKLVKQLLSAVIYNFTGTNQKISCIKMTHEFLLRAFFCFVVFLAIQAVWPAAAWAIGRIHNEIITPLMSCFP